GRVAERLDRTFDRLTGTVERRLERHRHELSGLAGRLDALSPLKILERGYALARDEQGRVLKRVVQFSSGLRFRLRVTDGGEAAQVRVGACGGSPRPGGRPPAGPARGGCEPRCRGRPGRRLGAPPGPGGAPLRPALARQAAGPPPGVRLGGSRGGGRGSGRGG